MKAYASVAALAALASAAALAGPTLTAEVNGMVCAFCAQGIEKNLRALPATQDVYVNLPQRIVAVEPKAGATITAETLTRVVRDAGYEVVSVKEVDMPAAALRGKATK